MCPAEVALFRGIINMDEDEADKNWDLPQAVQNHWQVSVVKKKENMDSYILKNLVENYAHLNIEGTETKVCESE
jgi:hypothetical protein